MTAIVDASAKSAELQRASHPAPMRRHFPRWAWEPCVLFIVISVVPAVFVGGAIGETPTVARAIRLDEAARSVEILDENRQAPVMPVRRTQRHRNDRRSQKERDKDKKGDEELRWWAATALEYTGGKAEEAIPAMLDIMRRADPRAGTAEQVSEAEIIPTRAELTFIYFPGDTMNRPLHILRAQQDLTSGAAE